VSEGSAAAKSLWQNRPVSLILVVPGVGVIAAFFVALVAVIVGRKEGSFRQIGMRSPESWPRLLGVTLGYGVTTQLVFTVVIEPILEKLTGSEIDISALDPIRGNFVNFVFMLAVGWILAAFIEEFAFRGFAVTRVHRLLGGGPRAIWIAIGVVAVPFGIAHMYQGPAGMIGTGLVGFVFGAIYVRHGYNLWYPVFAHGFINTIAITVVYFDVDKILNDLVF
jgi:hypothetical protein